jgi:hypothetical protein
MKLADDSGIVNCKTSAPMISEMYIPRIKLALRRMLVTLYLIPIFW